MPAAVRSPVTPAACVRASLTWLVRWPIEAWRTRVLASIPVFLLAMLAGIFYVGLANRLWRGTEPPNDFDALWLWSVMVHSVPHPMALYAPDRVAAFMHAAWPDIQGPYPFAYPPSFLLLIWPLALGPAKLAYLLWTGISLIAYLAAAAEAPWRRPIVLLLLFAPATGVAIEAGQDGLLLAALLIGGCRLVRQRPLLGGILLGLASWKPQFGLLVPLALVAAREWRAIASATATVLASVVASSVAFGWAMWPRWLAALLYLFGFVAGQARLHALAPTVVASLHMLGAGALVRDVAQIAAFLLAAAGVWYCWRRGTDRLAAAALLAGCFLATPYAFFYDLPILMGAVVAVVLERVEAEADFGLVELIVLLGGVMLAGLIVKARGPVPWTVFLMPPVFAVIVARAWRLDRAQRRAHARPPAPAACRPA
jgi:alpha-1,2-mannosyltransferase